MKIAVTGSAGTIGSRLCADLENDHVVTRLDVRDGVDVQDIGALEARFRECEAVIHLAGVVEVETSWEDTYGPNILGTYNAFEAARRCGVRRFIFASSNHCVGMHEVENAPAIYRPAFGLVVRNDTPYRPDGLYGVWKAFGEVLGRYYSDHHPMLVTCIRIGSITAEDNPRHPSVADSSAWLKLTVEQRYERYAATWMSHADFARLVRCILEQDVPYAVVYGVGDNLTRFWDLEPGRALFGFWPQDGTRESTVR